MITDLQENLGDFLEKLEFFYPEQPSDKSKDKQFPTLKEILEYNIPPCAGERPLEEFPLIDKLPSAFSPAYIRTLLEEDGICPFSFENQTPSDIIKTIQVYCLSICQSERNVLCQRLNVLAAFCSFWMRIGDGWNHLAYATYEPVCFHYEKPKDIFVLRARAAVTPSTKSHRALRDLNRLQELDPINSNLYQAETEKWKQHQNRYVQSQLR